MSVLTLSTVEQGAPSTPERDRTATRPTAWLTAAVEALRDFRTTS